MGCCCPKQPIQQIELYPLFGKNEISLVNSFFYKNPKNFPKIEERLERHFKKIESYLKMEGISLGTFMNYLKGSNKKEFKSQNPPQQKFSFSEEYLMEQITENEFIEFLMGLYKLGNKGKEQLNKLRSFLKILYVKLQNQIKFTFYDTQLEKKKEDLTFVYKMYLVAFGLLFFCQSEVEKVNFIFDFLCLNKYFSFHSDAEDFFRVFIFLSSICELEILVQSVKWNQTLFEISENELDNLKTFINNNICTRLLEIMERLLTEDKVELEFNKQEFLDLFKKNCFHWFFDGEHIRFYLLNEQQGNLIKVSSNGLKVDY